MQQFPPNRDLTPWSLDQGMTIYLLHIDYPDGTCDHYCGSTKAGEFRRRMRAHASGYGTTRTKAMYDKRPTMFLVRTWQRDNRTWEKTLHRQNDHAPWCSICSPWLAPLLSAVPAPFRLDGAEPPRIASLSLGAIHP